MLYQIPEHVLKNIIAIVDNADIKGGQAIVIIEIKNCLSKPVPEAMGTPSAQKPTAPDKK